MAMMSSHNHLAFAFGILGNIISFMVFLAPIPTFIRIYKRKSTEGFQALPYLVALFSSMLWLYYAFLKKNAIFLVTINSFGCLMEIIYIIIFITYAPRDARKLTFKLFLAMNVASFALILLVTHFTVNDSLRAQVLGWICVSVSVSVFAAPLSIVAQVIRTRSVEFMPFNLSFFLTLSAIMWFAYGLFLKDICIALPNVLGFGLGIVQMLLYAIYRNGRKGSTVIEEKGKEKEQELPEPLKNVVVVTPLALGASEVFPVDANSTNTVQVEDAHGNRNELEEEANKVVAEEDAKQQAHHSESESDCPV